MEIRGGTGYIEEWLDPKILRDAHLGSIWEGTSNIISLDTIRALKKADNIHVLKNFLINLVQERSIKENEKVLLSTIDEVFNFVFQETNDDYEASSRQITSLLYYLCSAVFLNAESYYCASLYNRKKISELIIKYKINENNPLQRNEIDYKLVNEYL